MKHGERTYPKVLGPGAEKHKNKLSLAAARIRGSLHAPSCNTARSGGIYCLMVTGETDAARIAAAVEIGASVDDWREAYEKVLQLAKHTAEMGGSAEAKRLANDILEAIGAAEKKKKRKK